MKKVVLVAGGTGGHIMPAISFGEWLVKNIPGVCVDYISGMRAMELDIYRSAGIFPHAISIEGSPLGAPKGMCIKRWRDMLRSYSETRAIMKEIKPDLCVLFGGYVSVPALFACLASGIRVVAHEQNAQAGRVTRLAHRLKVPVAAGWERCDPIHAKDFTYTGVPVRELAPMGRAQAADALGLKGITGGQPIVVIMTGSLGSRLIRDKAAMLSEREDFKTWNFVVVTPEVKEPFKQAENFFCLPRRWDVAPLFALADLLVLRAGASTLTEAWAVDKPALVVPWRKASRDHQMKNARAFAQIGKAAIWDENEEDLETLARKIMILYKTYATNADCQDKRMYNATEYICAKLWNMARAGDERGDLR